MPRQPSGGNRRLAMVYMGIGVFLLMCIAFVLFKILNDSSFAE